MNIAENLTQAGIIPVVTLERAGEAVPLCKALAAGGLRVAEITFRAAAAAETLALLKREFPDFVLGAGTVTREVEVDLAAAAGAQFAVAPGLNPRIVRRAKAIGLPLIPGVCTPTEIEAALNLGCTLLKYFPAASMGGITLLDDLYAPYKHRGVRFIPTGGIGPANLAEYLAHPAVVACAGSWLSSGKLVAAQAWEEVTRLTRDAVTVCCARRQP